MQPGCANSRHPASACVPCSLVAPNRSTPPLQNLPKLEDIPDLEEEGRGEMLKAVRAPLCVVFGGVKAPAPGARGCPSGSRGGVQQACPCHLPDTGRTRSAQPRAAGSAHCGAAARAGPAAGGGWRGGGHRPLPADCLPVPVRAGGASWWVLHAVRATAWHKTLEQAGAQARGLTVLLAPSAAPPAQVLDEGDDVWEPDQLLAVLKSELAAGEDNGGTQQGGAGRTGRLTSLRAALRHSPGPCPCCAAFTFRSAPPRPAEKEELRQI